MARDGHVGQEVYDRTNALVAEGKTRQDAFEQIASERGSKAGTIAANFYRVARKQLEQNGSRPSKQTRTRTRRPAVKPEPVANGMAAQLEACIRTMVDEAVERRMQRLVSS